MFPESASGNILRDYSSMSCQDPDIDPFKLPNIWSGPSWCLFRATRLPPTHTSSLIVDHSWSPFLFLSFQECSINGTQWHAIFWHWFLSSSTILWRKLCCCVGSIFWLFPFLLQSSITECGFLITSFNHSLTEVHLGSFQFGVIANRIATNICLRFSFHMSTSLCFVLVVCRVCFFFNARLFSGAAVHSHQQCTRDLYGFLPILTQHLVLTLFIILAIFHPLWW
jgi:hypothetical protein